MECSFLAPDAHGGDNIYGLHIYSAPDLILDWGEDLCQRLE